jgi:hypothetical protein
MQFSLVASAEELLVVFHLQPSAVLVLELGEGHAPESVGVQELPLAVHVVQPLALGDDGTGENHSVIRDGPK